MSRKMFDYQENIGQGCRHCGAEDAHFYPLTTQRNNPPGMLLCDTCHKAWRERHTGEGSMQATMNKLIGVALNADAMKKFEALAAEDKTKVDDLWKRLEAARLSEMSAVLKELMEALSSYKQNAEAALKLAWENARIYESIFEPIDADNKTSS